MRSILEKALIALLNEEREKADALFHEFILERSRQIHESLRQGEDFVLDESWENELAIDEMFTEADLIGEDDEEESDDDQVNEFAFDDDSSDDSDSDTDTDTDTDADVDADADVDSADDSAVDADVDAEDDVDADEDDIETRVDDIEAELQKLAAEFDALVSGDAGDSADADAFVDTDGADGGEFDDMDAEADSNSDSDLGDDDGDDVEESFDDFTESFVSELDKVSVKMDDGTELGGGKITQNKKSPGLQPKLNDRALKGEPVVVKSTEHNGFDKEPSPKTGDLIGSKTYRNTKAKAADGRSKVSKEGNKSAMLNDLKTNKGDDKSVIGSGKVMGKNL
jgi:hypothetical protein